MNSRALHARITALTLGLASALSAGLAQSQAYDLDILGTNPALPTVPLFARQTSVTYVDASRVGGITGNKLLTLQLNDGLLCGDYSSEAAVGNANPVRLRLTDVNRNLIANAIRPGTDFAVDSFGGLAGNVIYKLKSATPPTRRVLELTINEEALLCRHLATQFLGAGYTLSKQFDSASSDFIFADRFENTPVTPPPGGNCTTGGTGSDVGVSIELPSGVNGVRGTTPLEYLIRVTNNGPSAVSEIQLRDFYYASSATTPNLGVFVPSASNLWNCDTGNCGTLPSDRRNNVYLPSFGLNSGQSAVVRVTRSWQTANGGADLNNVPFGIAAAVFTPNTNASVRDPNRCNDVAVFNRTIRNNLPPTISGLSSNTVTILEGSSAGLGIPSFQVSDPDGASVVITATATTSPSGILNASVTPQSSTATTRTLQGSLVDNDVNGSTSISVTARDPEGDNSQTVSVPVNVLPVNDKPSFSFNITPTTTNCTGATFTPANGSTPARLEFARSSIVRPRTCSGVIDFNRGASNESTQTLSVVDPVVDTGSSSFLAMDASKNILPNTAQDNVNITFALLANQSGVATVSFRVRDSGGVANSGVDLSDVIPLTIRIPSALPTISQLSTQNTNEDTAVVQSLTISDPDNNPATFANPTVTSTNNSLIDASRVSFGAPVVVDANTITRSVTMTPKPDQFGSATVRISVSDGDGVAFTEFQFNVASVNDAPSFQAPLEINFPAGTAAGKGLQVSPFATGMSVGPSNEQGIQNLDFFSVSILNSPTNQVVETATPPVVAVGSGNMLITLKDSGNGTAVVGASCVRVRLFDSGSNSAPNVNNFARIVKVRVGGADTTCPAN